MMAMNSISWDHERLKLDRRALVQAEMQRQGMAALLLNDGVHLRYLLDLNVPGARVFIPAEGDVVAIARSRDLGYVSAQHGTVALRRDNVDEVKDLMRQVGATGERLGIDTLKAASLLELVDAGVQIADAGAVIEQAWTVKTQDELNMYRAIGQHYVRTLESFRDAIRPGVTEEQLASQVIFTWLQVGGEDMAQLNVCAGANMNPWVRWASAHPVADGEFVAIDLHGRGIGGLRGDASTTFLAGEHPSTEQKDLYRRAHDYLTAAVQAMRAGRSIAEVMRTMPTIPEQYREQQSNYNFSHGIGMGSSGYPHLDPRRKPIDDVLRSNQVLAVECYFAEVGSPLAVKIEEQIVVRDGDPEILGAVPVDERLLH